MEIPSDKKKSREKIAGTGGQRIEAAEIGLHPLSIYARVCNNASPTPASPTSTLTSKTFFPRSLNHQLLLISTRVLPSRRFKMAPATVSMDFSDDFAPAPPVKANPVQRTLLLAPPSVAAHEEKLKDIFTVYDRAASDLHMLDRLNAGFVKLPASTYDLVLVLTDTTGERRGEALKLLSRDVYTALVPAMKDGGSLRLQDGPLVAAEAREAILAGLVEKNGAFEKAVEEEVVVPLRFGKKKTNGAQNGTAVKPVQPAVQIDLDDDFGDDDELVDENELLTADDLARPIMQRKFLLSRTTLNHH